MQWELQTYFMKVLDNASQVCYIRGARSLETIAGGEPRRDGEGVLDPSSGKSVIVTGKGGPQHERGNPQPDHNNRGSVERHRHSPPLVVTIRTNNRPALPSPGRSVWIAEWVRESVRQFCGKPQKYRGESVEGVY